MCLPDFHCMMQEKEVKIKRTSESSYTMSPLDGARTAYNAGVDNYFA